MKTYHDSVHFYGRIWVALGIFLMLMVPVSVCVYYGSWPELQYVVKGLLGVAPIFCAAFRKASSRVPRVKAARVSTLPV